MEQNNQKDLEGNIPITKKCKAMTSPLQLQVQFKLMVLGAAFCLTAPISPAIWSSSRPCVKASACVPAQ